VHGKALHSSKKVIFGNFDKKFTRMKKNYTSRPFYIIFLKGLFLQMQHSANQWWNYVLSKMREKNKKQS
jgi:hypothetical protein